MSNRGRIVEWNRERGFGYLECDRRRIFLHWREFKERHKRPEVGDIIFFSVGEDKQGRPCAKEAIHANDGGRLSGVHLLIFLALLALPIVAMARISTREVFGLAVGWLIVVSLITYLAYARDKRLAREKAWREPELGLHFLELVGGWPGAFLAQRRLRHKASKASYQASFILIVGLHQLLAVDALCGWPSLSALAKILTKALAGLS